MLSSFWPAFNCFSAQSPADVSWLLGEWLLSDLEIHGSEACCQPLDPPGMPYEILVCLATTGIPKDEKDSSAPALFEDEP